MDIVKLLAKKFALQGSQVAFAFSVAAEPLNNPLGGGGGGMGYLEARQPH